MPYPNFHSARIKDPDLFDHIVVLKTLDNKIMIYGGPLKSDPNGPTETQAYRFPKDKFTAAEAKKWLKDNDIKYISFEPASESKSNPDEIEYRTMSDELRVEGDGGKLIVGHAAVFNQKSLPMWGFQEQVLPGAFKKTIQESDIRALWNHNPRYVLGRNKAATLELSEDKIGLAVKITPPDTQWANDLRESIKRKDVTQMSFGFRTIKDSFHTEEGIITRDLEEVQLFDVSPVTYPAYPATDVSVRAIAYACSELNESENSKLFKTMLRMKDGEELRAEELALLSDFAVTLQKKLKPSEPGPAHSDAPKPPESRHLDVEKLKLDLIKIQEEMK